MSRYRSKPDVSITELCEWTSIPRSIYYYKPKDGKPGAKPSTHTYTLTGERVANEQIIAEIRSILEREFANYGYEITSGILKRTYVINEKKVYRLMKDEDLLFNRPVKSTEPREFVKFRSVKASYPMEYLSMDIKYVYVAGEQRHYYLMEVIDVFSKKVLHHILQRSIRKKDVLKFLKALKNRYSIKNVTIRTDNGSQFIAKIVRDFLRLAEVKHEFSRPATPEENCYIEAFHSILESAVIQRFEFEGYYEAKLTIERFIDDYNTYRPHRSVGMLTPSQMWDQGLALIPDKQPEARIAEGLSRPDSESMRGASASYSLDHSGAIGYICGSGINVNLNHFEKPVQLIGG